MKIDRISFAQGKSIHITFIDSDITFVIQGIEYVTYAFVFKTLKRIPAAFYNFLSNPVEWVLNNMHRYTYPTKLLDFSFDDTTIECPITGAELKLKTLKRYITSYHSYDYGTLGFKLTYTDKKLEKESPFIIDMVFDCQDIEEDMQINMVTLRINLINK